MYSAGLNRHDLPSGERVTERTKLRSDRNPSSTSVDTIYSLIAPSTDTSPGVRISITVVTRTPRMAAVRKENAAFRSGFLLPELMVFQHAVASTFVIPNTDKKTAIPLMK